ncbi:MAG: GGDEF domain-containing protein [Lachnospiraceae bacterium]|nr:GGDEF domain-containing protein [Lachnospiraceae bacterium]
MDYQDFVDRLVKIACVVSVDTDQEDGNAELCIEAANKAYLKSVDVDPKAFKPGRPYHEYIGREYNFESMALKCIREERLLHAYVDAELYNAWMDIYMMPLVSDTPGRGYCLFSYEMNRTAVADKLSDVSPQTALQVLRTTLKLREANDFHTAMDSIIEDIRENCRANCCRILLTDYEHRTCKVLCESMADPSIPSMTTYLDDSFFDVVDTWGDLMAGSNCVVIHDARDMEKLQLLCPIWFRSLQSAKVHNIVMFPIRWSGNTLGYIWATNFDAEQTVTIRSTLEITTFILASEISYLQLFEKMRDLSIHDLLTGVYNRYAMNDRIAGILAGTEMLGRSYGIVFLDVNGLKHVNDTQGHLMGDQVLKDAVALIQSVFRSHDIYRMGGDEFLVLVKNTSLDDLNRLVNKIRAAQAASNTVKLAIGMCFADGEQDIRKAMHIADENMFRDKKNYYHSGC